MRAVRRARSSIESLKTSTPADAAERATAASAVARRRPRRAWSEEEDDDALLASSARATGRGDAGSGASGLRAWRAWPLGRARASPALASASGLRRAPGLPRRGGCGAAARARRPSCVISCVADERRRRSSNDADDCEQDGARNSHHDPYRQRLRGLSRESNIRRNAFFRPRGPRRASRRAALRARSRARSCSAPWRTSTSRPSTTAAPPARAHATSGRLAVAVDEVDDDCRDRRRPIPAPPALLSVVLPTRQADRRVQFTSRSGGAGCVAPPTRRAPPPAPPRARPCGSRPRTSAARLAQRPDRSPRRAPRRRAPERACRDRALAERVEQARPASVLSASIRPSANVSVLAAPIAAAAAARASSASVERGELVRDRHVGAAEPGRRPAPRTVSANSSGGTGSGT